MLQIGFFEIGHCLVSVAYTEISPDNRQRINWLLPIGSRDCPLGQAAFNAVTVLRVILGCTEFIELASILKQNTRVKTVSGR